MIRSFLGRTVLKSRALLLREGRDLSEFMRLLMKQRNTGEAWTPAEVRRLKSHVRRLLVTVPALLIFALPFGSLLLPLLAEILDRRSGPRVR